MRLTRALVPTVKEVPQDATNVSHVLLTRAGFIRRVGAGMYDFLPLGLRTLRKIEGVIRDEMNRAGAEEVLLPALLPAEYFKESGRWDKFGGTLFRLKDRKGADFNLGPTHEEIITDIARREIKSYRDLPKNLYQVQTKFRDEPRPRGGLLRCREFIMKDAYSFDVSEDAAKESYEKMRLAYTRIFDRLGLTYRLVAADSGAMGGSVSAEFQILADSGEDAIVACDGCDYAANLEVATVRSGAEAVSNIREEPLGKVHTPGKGGIDDVVSELKIAAKDMLKCLLYVAGDGVVMAVVRGDHDVNEMRLARALGVSEVFLANEGDVRRLTGAAVGYAGPVGYKGRFVVDRAATYVKNAVTGANETDYHLTGVNWDRDFKSDVVDIRLACTGDPCPACSAGKLVLYKGIEGGHIFILGTHYSEKMGATFLDEAQQKKNIVMGCYGIGVSRLVATAIEQHHDADGICWPMSIAPYQVHLCTLGKDAAVLNAAKDLYEKLSNANVEVLWDDRDERPGVKFKDADLIGIPLRVTIGEKGIASGNVELKRRVERDPKKVEMISVRDAPAKIEEIVRAALA